MTNTLTSQGNGRCKHSNDVASTRRLAVLIDAENAQPAIIGQLLAEIAKYGVATVRRIYGDFTATAHSSWRKKLLEFSIQPIQQFRNTVGKNASDSAMIIDAMDLLHSSRFDGFCIVSSDSDFTRLATRIREEGVLVYGFGERRTPKSFVAACDKFTFTEVLPEPKPSKPAQQLHKNIRDANGELLISLRRAVEACADETGRAKLAAVGSIISNSSPEFDPRNYGFKNLVSLVEATAGFEIERGDDGFHPLVRLKAPQP